MSATAHSILHNCTTINFNSSCDKFSPLKQIIQWEIKSEWKSDQVCNHPTLVLKAAVKTTFPDVVNEGTDQRSSPQSLCCTAAAPPDVSYQGALLSTYGDGGGNYPLTWAVNSGNPEIFDISFDVWFWKFLTAMLVKNSVSCAVAPVVVGWENPLLLGVEARQTKCHHGSWPAQNPEPRPDTTHISFARWWFPVSPLPSGSSLPEDIVRFHTAVLVARAHNRYTQRVARHRDSPAETTTHKLNKRC